jgi:hypothetical protein
VGGGVRLGFDTAWTVATAATDRASYTNTDTGPSAVGTADCERPLHEDSAALHNSNARKQAGKGFIANHPQVTFARIASGSNFVNPVN